MCERVLPATNKGTETNNQRRAGTQVTDGAGYIGSAVAEAEDYLL